jgi:hypothetical protein
MQLIMEKINNHEPRLVATEGRAMAWGEILSPVPFDIASEAVNRFYSNPDEPKLLHAGGLLAICKEIRSERRDRRDAQRAAEERAARRALTGAPEKEHTPETIVVESPFLKWEHERKRPAWQDPEPVRPILSDADKIAEFEANRKRMLAAMEALMTEEERNELGK